MEQEQRGKNILMPLRQVDWLVVWKIYHYPYFFWMYAVLSLVTRFLICRHLNSGAPIKTWFLSSAASLLIVPAVPFLAVPAFALAAIAVGKVAVYSLLMALPIALSVGLFAGLVDGILLRVLLREAVGRKRMWLLFGMNLVVTHCCGWVRGRPHVGLPSENHRTGGWLALTGHFTQIPPGKADECN
jgi:hypothetical protein